MERRILCLIRKGGHVVKTFCSIGKAVLTKALGLQQNYREVIESEREVIDTEASGCESCRWHKIKTVTRPDEELYAECESACASCPYKVMKTEITYKRVYHNEKNRYGYQPRLKTNAIKLLIALHFQDEVDNIGFIKNINLKGLAKLLSCNIKTIHNCLETLKEYGYISFTKTDVNLITVWLPEYENYFKPASSGGRGFLTLSDAVFTELLSIKNLNELRISVRQLMEFEILTNTRKNTVEKSYKELRRMLPNYCKRNIIKRAAEKLSMFIVEMKDNLIRFIIKPEYDAKTQKEQQLEFYEKELITFSQEFAHDVAELNTSIHNTKDSKYSDFFEGTEVEEYRCWFFTPLEIADLATLCLQYSWHRVMKALQSIYRTYKLQSGGTTIQNLGGLVRTVILANA